MFGFGPNFNPDTDIPDLTGRVALVTGANSGLGYLTVLHLASHGAKVYLTTRSEEKALDTVRRLEQANPKLKDSGLLQWLILDLGLVTKAKAAAEEFMRRETRLDLLINNAAQLGTPFKLTPEGLSDIFAANHVSPFEFSTTLMPLLEATARQPDSDVRVITMSSVEHFQAPTKTQFDSVDDFRDPCGSASNPDTMTAKMARYRHAKLANVLFAKELQRRWDEAGVPAISMSLHPGVVATEGSEKLIRSFGGAFAWWLLRALFIVDINQGVITGLYAATSPDILKERQKFKGQYIVPFGKVGKASELARKEGVAERLWELTERVVKEILEKGSI